jgi:hypothetical protein
MNALSIESAHGLAPCVCNHQRQVFSPLILRPISSFAGPGPPHTKKPLPRSRPLPNTQCNQESEAIRMDSESMSRRNDEGLIRQVRI